jgi:predicted nucleic acid-binding protein
LSVYLDASVLVSLFIRDELTERARSTLRARTGTVIVSDWTTAESASAIARAVRTGVLDREAARRAIASIDLWVSRAAERIEVLSADIREAELIIRSFETTLKAPDALHIVVARRLGLPLLSFDVAMMREATALGVPTAP